MYDSQPICGDFYPSLICKLWLAPQGDVIFTEFPLVAVPFDETLFPTPKGHATGLMACHNCLRALPPMQVLAPGSAPSREHNLAWPRANVADCEHCAFSRYCGKECRDSAWKRHHSLLCTRNE